MRPFTPKDPDFAARCRASFASQTLLETIGARMAVIEPGRCVLELASRPDLCQQDGFLHAGITTTLADTAGGYAAFSLMPASARVLTSELKINLLNPARGDRLVARADVLKPGRMLTIVRADVFAITGIEEIMIASMLATMVCLMPQGD